MVEAVNRLIFNILISERALFLPTIGTLFVERTGATHNGKSIVAPRYTVAFTSQTSGTSIVDVIAAVANVDTATANDIFERWMAKTKDGNTLQISGVGTLKDKTFITDNSLINELNITQFTDISIQKKRGSVLRWGLPFLSLTIIMAVGAYLYYIGYTQIPETTTTEPLNPETEVITEDIITKKDNIEETIVVIEEDAVVEEIIEDDVVIEPVTEAWTVSKDIRHRVIVGSYSTTDNAQRAISDIERRMPELTCSIYRLGSMYAVAIYGSAEKDDCQMFMQKYRDDFSQIWIHTPKRYR